MLVVLFAGGAVVAVVQVTSENKSILSHPILYPVEFTLMDRIS